MGYLSTLIFCYCFLFPSFVVASDRKSVFIQTASIRPIFDQFTYPARITSEIDATVLAESSGIIKQLNYRLGQAVKKSSTLLQIQHTDPVYQYRSFISKAPVAGVVSKIYVSQGSLVKKGDHLLRITDPHQLKILIEVPVSDLKSVKANMPAELSLPYKDKPLRVRLTGISPILDPATGTASAELELEDPHQAHQVKIGIFGEVSFSANWHKGLSVPDYAIVYEGKKPQLKIVKDAILKRVDVKLGQKRQGQVEILEGIQAGDDVVIRSSGFIPNGSEVEVKRK